MERRYTQTVSLVIAGQGAFLSEAKTDNVGEPQCKSGASPHKPPFLCGLSFSFSRAVLQGEKPTHSVELG